MGKWLGGQVGQWPVGQVRKWPGGQVSKWTDGMETIEVGFMYTGLLFPNRKS